MLQYLWASARHECFGFVRRLSTRRLSASSRINAVLEIKPQRKQKLWELILSDAVSTKVENSGNILSLFTFLEDTGEKMEFVTLLRSSPTFLTKTLATSRCLKIARTYSTQPMRKFTLNTGAQVPAIGFGTFQDPDAQEDAVYNALKHGVRHIDTARVYAFSTRLEVIEADNPTATILKSRLEEVSNAAGFPARRSS